MTTACHIPLAACQEVYQMASVERAIEHAPPGRNEGLLAYYERMREAGGVRWLVKPSRADSLDPLYEDCPNFAEVLDDVRKQLALSVSGDEPVHFMPILLLGAPGLGKTHFAKRLAQVLGTGFEFISMSSMTAGWILSGASSQWSNAKPGRVAQTLVDGQYANPVIALDEVDKAAADSRYDPLGALYTLLEHDTARHFRDEFVEVDMDASHLLWIATANDEQRIPEPILSRMNVYEIPLPDAAGARRIALNVYRDILADHHWGFPATPDDDVLDRLAEIPPREMRKRLIDAFGNAVLDQRDELRADDIRVERAPARRARIGF